MRGTSGQATVEWVALVALVAVLLGAVGAAFAQAGFLGRRVTRELARAVCVVSAGDCWRDREPCVVGAADERSSWRVGVAILRVGHDRVALVERRSDGTYAVTLEGAWSGGVEASAGTPRAHVRLAGLDFSAGGAVTASLLARLGDGRTWVVGSAAQARAIVAAGGAGRPPDVVYDDRAWLSGLSVSLGLEGPGGSGPVAGATAAFDQHWGSATDRRTGHRTTSIHASWSGAVKALGQELGMLGGGSDGPVIAIEVDASGRPLDLRITTTGTLDGSRSLPDVVQSEAGLLQQPLLPGGADRRYEVTTHLDLTDPRALAAARDLIGALGAKHARALPGPELRALIAAHGTVEARILADAPSNSHDTALSGGFGDVALGYEHHVERHDRALLAAASRGLDGQWITRTDCVAA